ncbi:MAG: hypothetical protein E7643_03425 [Ruminococcaceae bacterium]|nr:hypothetical protein [Oscillospiraceae bacterium]
MLKFGWGKRSIAMDGPVGIIGQPHLRISLGVRDELLVTALVIDDGNEISVMLSGDLIFADDGIIHDVRAAVREKNPEIPVEKILFNATHTHTSLRYERCTDYDIAPFDGIEMTDPEVCRSFLTERAAEAVLEAYETRCEGSYSYGYSYAVVGHHRRPIYTDDLRTRPGEAGARAFAVNKHAKMYGKTNDPAFSGYEGNVDSAVYFLFTFDKEEHLSGVIVNVACPSQCSEQLEQLSADYWVEVRELIRQQYGDICVLPQCACAGDIAPRCLHAFAAERRRNSLKYAEEASHARMDIAERILAALNECYAWASKEKIGEAKLFHSVRNVELEAWEITKEQYLAAKEEYDFYSSQKFESTDDKIADFKKNTKLGWLRGRCESIIRRYEENIDRRKVELHLIRLGDVAFASNPFELYTAYQHRIQARSPFVQTFTVQLSAADTCDYLPTKLASENMGYGAVIQSCTVSPKGGDTLVEETIVGLEQLYRE